jgi:hypothetical protein
LALDLTMTLEASEKIYLADLDELERTAEALPNTRMHVIAKVASLAVMNMRWERIMVDRTFNEHPWPHAQRLVADARAELQAWSEAAFIEGPSELLGGVSDGMEDRHHDLFQDLWVNFSEPEYEDRVARYSHRLEINGLADGFFAGKRVIDFGCGHGNFLHACLRAGAASGVGIDYGEESIAYAAAARDRLGVSPQQLEFRTASVYASGEPDSATTWRSRTASFTISTTRTLPTARSTASCARRGRSGSTPTEPAGSATICGMPRCASSGMFRTRRSSRSSISLASRRTSATTSATA